MTKQKKVKIRESIAWCPCCNDSLETITIWKKDKIYRKIIDHWEYYCFSCDKFFILKEKNEMKESGGDLNE